MRLQVLCKPPNFFSRCWNNQFSGSYAAGSEVCSGSASLESYRKKKIINKRKKFWRYRLWWSITGKYLKQQTTQHTDIVIIFMWIMMINYALFFTWFHGPIQYKLYTWSKEASRRYVQICVSSFFHECNSLYA